MKQTHINLENKRIIWMCLVEQIDKGMDGLSGLRNQISGSANDLEWYRYPAKPHLSSGELRISSLHSFFIQSVVSGFTRIFMKFCDETLSPPILAYAHNYSHGEVEPPHTHQCAQFLHALNGVIRVDTPSASWVVTTNQGLWIPAGISHSLRITGDVRVRTLFVDPMARADLPNTCVLAKVSSLLTSLIVAAVSLPDIRIAGTREERIFELILDELRLLNPIDFYLPNPTTEALVKLCQNVSERLAHPWTASDAAKFLGQSERTISRRFQQELGLTFTEWLRQRRLLHASELLASGDSVLETALAIGYDSPSAFSAMFKSRTGLSPSEYALMAMPSDLS